MLKDIYLHIYIFLANFKNSIFRTRNINFAFSEKMKKTFIVYIEIEDYRGTRRIQENTGEYRRIQENTGEYRRIQENN